MLRGIPSAAGAPQTAGLGKPPDPAPAGLPVGKPLWPDAMYRVAASFSLRAYPWYSGFWQSATVCPARHCRLRG
ncbi:TPA: hypothetical protein ACJY20_002277, partial [Neisseria gonorrhoeae]